MAIAMPEPLQTIPMTCVRDGKSHEVTDEAVAKGLVSGLYQAICDQTIAPGALESPDGPMCPVCFARLRASHRRALTQSPRSVPQHLLARLTELMHPVRQA
jgi:hypothetical protein